MSLENIDVKIFNKSLEKWNQQAIKIFYFEYMNFTIPGLRSAVLMIYTLLSLS
jgi:hypothetical protein